MKRALVLALGLTLAAAACVAQPQTSRDLDRIGRDYQREAADAQRTARAQEQDTCGIAANQSLIGKTPREFQTPSNARVVCFGCAMTMDFSAERLTIQLGRDGRVESLRCG
ncbi:MAG: I78 family peptidase inhibitor [Hyphomonadaceae bacterium]|nr:I78 family peptidase inhibitor [Hyphomonadaceae bacterium]